MSRCRTVDLKNEEVKTEVLDESSARSAKTLSVFEQSFCGTKLARL